MAMNGFLRNAWYMAAWAEEVPEGGLLARKLLGQDWVIWRKGDGQWAMLADRCPHRFAPLSKGRRMGDTIRCGYHGLGYDETGACVHNPFGQAVPPGMKVPAMALVERHSALWFWPGDPMLADPARIPDFSFMDEPHHVRVALVMDVDYRLIVDNLMDLTHVEFMHIETFGVNGSMLDHGHQSVVTQEDGAIWNNWAVENAPPPQWAEALLSPGQRVDQWINIRWHAPASMALHVGLAMAGTGHAQMVVPAMANPHILTPESESTTHYFCSHGPEEGARALMDAVFMNEDEPMMRAVQERMGGADFWDLRPAILPSDAAAIRVRRRMQHLARIELGGPRPG
jgi:phenylpropionate dioxygenase-like ring-hydroxylating dioxygenase large terminal subunit